MANSVYAVVANSVEPDETARHEPSHLGLHCLQRYMFWSAGLKELRDWRHLPDFPSFFTREAIFVTCDSSFAFLHTM